MIETQSPGTGTKRIVWTLFALVAAFCSSALAVTTSSMTMEQAQALAIEQGVKVPAGSAVQREAPASSVYIVDSVGAIDPDEGVLPNRDSADDPLEIDDYYDDGIYNEYPSDAEFGRSNDMSSSLMPPYGEGPRRVVRQPSPVGDKKYQSRTNRSSRASDKTMAYRRDNDTANLRWAQKIFRNANPSLFASHVGAVGADYMLGPGDQIILTVWGEKEARYDLTLDRDGQVRIEMAGVVSLNGRSMQTAESLLKERLSKIYGGLNNGSTHMDLTLGKLKQVRVFVVGDVVQPGSYLLSGNTSVFSALYQAKGITDLGTERNVIIVRGNKELSIDLYDYLAKGRRSTKDVLQDGDVIRVVRRGPVVTIHGDIGRPGKYELLPEEGLKDLLGYAAGANITTASTSIVAMRYFSNGRKEAVRLPSPDAIAGGATADIVDGDSLFVYSGADTTATTVTIRGMVRYPGAYPWKAGMTVGQLVAFAGGSLPAAYLPRALVTRSYPEGKKEQYRVDISDSAASLELSSHDVVDVFDQRMLKTKKRVRISGAVKSPRSYEWKEGMTVKDLILLSGGFRHDAEYGNVRIERPLDRERGASEELIELDSSLSTASADRRLEPDCHLSVPFNPNFKRLDLIEIRGWVAHPGTYALKRPDERISELLKRAGGPLPSGYLAGARLLRSEGNTGRIQVKFVEALKTPGSIHDLVLRAGDTILVPKEPATVRVSGRVNSPGNVIWSKGKSWKWYIQQTGGLADSAFEDGIYVEFADGWVETVSEGIIREPDPGARIEVPQRPPAEPISLKGVFEGINMVLGTVIAGLTIFVLMNTTK